MTLELCHPKARLGWTVFSKELQSPARRRRRSLSTWPSPWAAGVSLRPGGWLPLEQVTGEGRADVSGARDLKATRTGPALCFGTPASTAEWGCGDGRRGSEARVTGSLCSS